MNYAQKKSELVNISKNKGYLTPEDILKSFPDTAEAVRVTEELADQGIAIIDEQASGAISIALPDNIISRETKPPVIPTDEESMRLYLHRLGDVKRLSDREKNALAEQAQKGAEKAIGELLETHQPLIVHIAKKFLKRGLPLYDLIQEGNVGLMQAIKRYDPSKRKGFTQLATELIRQEMKKAVDNYARMIHIPKDIISIIRKLHKTAKDLAQKLSRTPKLEEVAKEAKVPLKKIQEIAKTSAVPLSFETPVGQEQANKLGDYLEDSEAELWDKIMQDDRREQLLEAITILPPLEQQIISLHYGLIDGQNWSYKELAAFFNLSEKQVKDMQEKALVELRKNKIE